MSRLIRLALLGVLLLVACAPAPVATPPPPRPPATTPVPASRGQLTTNAQRWLTDGPRRLSRELGLPLGLVIALDQYDHAHMAYQTSVDGDGMGALAHGKVVVRGTTPAGDPYEQVLWTGQPGLANTGIGAWGERLVVTAGVPLDAGLQVLVWVSDDGGQTWGAAPTPLSGAFDADVAFTPEGDAVLAAGLWLGGDRFQTQIVLEQGRGRWRSVQSFPSTCGGGRHAVWTRDATNPAQAGLPALLVLASRSDGFDVGRSADGLTWETTSVRTATADQPLLVATDATLLALHTVYGRHGIWLARSGDGGRTWDTAQQFVDAQVWVGPGALLWDAHAQRVFLLLDWFDIPSGERRIALTSAALGQVLGGDAAWTPDWRTHAWTPVALPRIHTHQLRPTGVQRGDLAVILWEGAFIPPDAAQTRTEADFRATYEPTYAILRVSQLVPVWANLVDDAPEGDDP
jgi:hypothetical protein